ncbi:hypothetical protein D3C71_1091510 [compost metagenome]
MPVLLERRREQTRRDGGDHAVAVRSEHTRPDQGPHIRAAAADRLRPALQERPTGPQHHRRRQRQLDPHPQIGRQAMQHGGHRQHRQAHRRHTQRQAPPEAAAEVGQLGILALIQAGHLRLQRHAAQRAGAGAFLHDLRVHGAGVQRAGGSWFGAVRCRIQIALRVCNEFSPASIAAEVVGAAVMMGMVGRGGRVDCHAADRVCGHPGARTGDLAVAVGGVHWRDPVNAVRIGHCS